MASTYSPSGHFIEHSTNSIFRSSITMVGFFYIKIPLRITSKRDHVLRTGIEPYVIISKLSYLQAVLQAVAADFIKSAVIVHPAFRKAVLQEIECNRWLSQMKQRFFRDASPHLHEQPLQHLHPPWQSLHFPSTLEDFVPC